MGWNDDWRTELRETNEPCYIRLCECRNTQKDIPVMASLLFKYNPVCSERDCLDRILEWVCDWNSQLEIDPTVEEYQRMLKQVK